MENNIDLFDKHELQPNQVKNILAKYDPESTDYDYWNECLAELELIGYTFDIDLDGIPQYLRPTLSLN